MDYFFSAPGFRGKHLRQRFGGKSVEEIVRVVGVIGNIALSKSVVQGSSPWQPARNLCPHSSMAEHDVDIVDTKVRFLLQVPNNTVVV